MRIIIYNAVKIPFLEKLENFHKTQIKNHKIIDKLR